MAMLSMTEADPEGSTLQSHRSNPTLSSKSVAAVHHGDVYCSGS